MTITIRFWGVRGSVPSPGPETAGVGGNTSCVEVRCRDQVVVLDAGTGLRRLGDALLAEAAGGPLDAAFLFSHVHWDHIQGFPFFAPVFSDKSTLELFGSPESGSLRDALVKQMTFPTFPVVFDDVPSTLRFHAVRPLESFRVGPFRVTTAPLNHPGGVLAYRLDAFGRSLVYATDTEHYDDGSVDETLVELARGADVLMYDAQYTPEEYDGARGPCRHGWGHSTWVEGVRVADAAGVGRLVLFHHDPSHDDATVAAIETAAAERRPGTVAAREGTSIELEYAPTVAEAA